MTYTELKELFLTLYDKWASNGAPGYDGYMISQVLTQAERNLIRRRIFGDRKYKLSFEETEKRAAEFQSLIKYAEPVVSTNQSATYPNGKFYDLPVDLWLAISEYADIEFKEDTGCYDSNIKEFVPVIPVRHDEVMANIDNPYWQPYGDMVWRVKFSETVSTDWYGIGTTVEGSTCILSTGFTGGQTVSSVNGTGSFSVYAISGDLYLESGERYYSITMSDGTFIEATSVGFVISGSVVPSSSGTTFSFYSDESATGVRKHELITDGSYNIDTYKLRYLKKPGPIVVESISNSVDGVSTPQTSELDEMFHEEIVSEAVRIAVANVDEQNAYQIKTNENHMTE